MQNGASAVVIVLMVALVIGSLSFYVMANDPCLLEGRDAMVKTTTLSSATLYSGFTATASNTGNASLFVSINNPGGTEYVLSIYMYATDIIYSSASIANDTQNLNNTKPIPTTAVGRNITLWQNTSSPSGFVNFSVHSSADRLVSGGVSTFTFYPRTNVSERIVSGVVYNYGFNFTNGDSISGSLIAQ